VPARGPVGRSGRKDFDLTETAVREWVKQAARGRRHPQAGDGFLCEGDPVNCYPVIEAEKSQRRDVRTWTPEAGVGYDLILLLNNIYYFPRGERTALYRRLGGSLTRPGHLIVATLAAPGSVAAAHLNFMLACQAGAAALPRGGELEADLAEAGFTGIHAQPIVPAEPFLAARAVLR
jgi:hypothetical protein